MFTQTQMVATQTAQARHFVHIINCYGVNHCQTDKLLNKTTKKAERIYITNRNLESSIWEVMLLLTRTEIRLFYAGQQSPLYDTFLRYKNFFDLFYNFKGYVNFFLLNDLVDENENVRFYLPFDNFKTKPTFTDVEEYLVYKKNVTDFINERNKRIDNYANKQTTEQNVSH